MVMFPDADGNPWTPPTETAPALHADNPQHVGNAPLTPNEQAIATGFLPFDDPGRLLSRYDVPVDMWKYWGPDIRGEHPRM